MLQLYATKNCAVQLKRLHKISTVSVENRQQGQYCLSTVTVKDRHGRTEISTGAVFAGEAVRQEFGDCIMWAETKGLRRATLNICGLGGMLDETELHSLGEYGYLTPGGRIIEQHQPELEGRIKSQQEIVADKMRAAGVEPGVVFWIRNSETRTSLIDGDPTVISRIRGILQPYWRSTIGRHTVDDEELEVLRNKMAELEIPFRSRSADAGPNRVN